MNSLKRFFKKFVIVLIVFSVLGGVAYLIFRPRTQPCFNGVQDNSETGVDCGGFCDRACPIPSKPDYVQDIEINWVKFVEDGRNNYDFIASVSNENESWGVSGLSYEFIYYNEAGDILGNKTGETYIMPKGTDKTEPAIKYIIEENIISNVRPARIEIKLADFKWEEVVSEKDLDNLNEGVVEISNVYFEMSKSLGIYIGGGLTKNTSIYDFIKVDIDVVLWGENDELLALGKTNQLTVASGDGWGFSSFFPNFTGDVTDVVRIDCRTETNVFDSNNFMKEYRGKE